MTFHHLYLYMFTNQPHEAAVVWSRLVFRIFFRSHRFLQQSSVTVNFFSHRPSLPDHIGSLT